MKRVVSVLLLVCMLVSLMGMSAAAYAEELPDGGIAIPPEATARQTGDGTAEQIPPAAEEPQPTEQPQPTEVPQPTQQPAVSPEVTDVPEATAQPQATEAPTAEEGFFAALTDTELEALSADVAKLGYTATDRAGLYALAVQLGIGDLESFCAWLDEELFVRDNAVAEVNGQLYLTLDEALMVLENNRSAEIRLVNDAVVYGLEVPAAHELTLDLNGHTLALEMQEGEAAPAPITVADMVENDEQGSPVYSYAALTLKNGAVTAGGADFQAIYDAGRLTLANVSVVGGIHVSASYERLTTLSIEPGDAFKTGFLNGVITADEGMEHAVSITGGDFITDVSSYIDTSAYECTWNEQTGIYTVARIKNEGSDNTADGTTGGADSADGAAAKLPALARTEIREGEVTLAEGVQLDNAAVTLTGLNNALSDGALAEIIAAYEAAAPAQTQQARGASRAAVTAAGDGSNDNDSSAADISSVADGTELQLKVRATLTAAAEGSSVSYEIKPCAVINGVEVPVKNEWLNGQAMLLSMYTGFMPAAVEHVHDDGTVETIDLNNCSYNNTTCVLTMNVSSFSMFRAQAAVSTAETFKSAITSAAAGGEVKLDADITLPDSAPINIDKNLTINLNGKTLSMTGAADAMFKITGGAVLTVRDGGNGGGNGSTLKITASTGTSAYISNIESGSLVLGDEAPASNMATFTATAPATGAGAASVTVLCAKTSFDPSAYVTNPYVAQGNATDGWTVDEYAAKLTAVTASGGVIGGGTTTTVTYHKTLKDALLKVNSSSQIDEIELLRNIDLSAAGETNPTTVSTRVILSGGTSKHMIKGNVSVAKDAGAAVDAKTIRNIPVEGDITVNSAVLNLLNVTVTGSVTDSGSSVLELTNTNISGALTAGDGSRLNFVTGSAGSVTATTGASAVNRDIKLSGVNVKNAITVGTYSNVECINVTAAGLTVADAPQGSTAANNPSVSIKSSSIGTVTTGAGMLKVELNALTATDVKVGSGTSLIEVKSLSGASNIGTLTIGENCGTTTIEGNLNGATTIGTLTVGTGTNPALGANTSSSAANDRRLVVGTISSAGQTTIHSGTYETLTGDGTKNTFVLYGGNYPRDYSQYCACDLNGTTGYYDHYVCKYQSAEGRWRVELLKIQLVSVTPAEVVKGSKTPITIIVNVPYNHACTRHLDVTGVDYYDSRLYNTTTLTPDKDYTAEPYVYTNADGTTSDYTKITISGDYVAGKTYQTYAVRTELGKVSATATVRTTLATLNRRSGLIRTGDDSNIGLLAGIMAVPLAVAAAAVLILKKKKHTDVSDVKKQTKPRQPKK